MISWANESFAITVSPAVRYCIQREGACWYDEGRLKYSGGSKKTVDANNAYLAEQAPIVRMRLKQAGVRLGAVLNQVYAGE